MALDLGDVLETLRILADWPSGSGKHGPARTRVGRWSFRAFLAIAAATAVAMLVVLMNSESMAAFDQAGLPVAVLGATALFVLLAVHIVAAIVANLIDRRRAAGSSRQRSVKHDG